MIDYSKPLQTRDGRPVTLLATNAPPETVEALGGRPLASPFLEQTVVCRIGDEVETFSQSDGRYFGPLDLNKSSLDLANVPEQRVEFRPLSTRHDRVGPIVGTTAYVSLDAARCETRFADPEGFLEIVKRGDTLVDVKFHPLVAPE